MADLRTTLRPGNLIATLLAGREGGQKAIRERMENIDVFDETKTEAAQENPLYLLGPIAYISWIAVIVTGALLMLFYIPTTKDAFDSILNIQERVPFCYLIRGLHKYGADALIIAVTLRLYRMYFNAEYKRPGELAWVIGVLTLVLAMISGITGYLLIWNQRAFWATKVVFGTAPTYLDYIPMVGDLHIGQTISQIFLGGVAVGQATLTRFYTAHYAISVVALILLEVYFYKTKLKRLNLTWVQLGIVSLILLVVTLTFQPVAVGRRANPLNTPLPILSDWYFLGLYQQLKYMPPAPAIISQGMMPLLAMLLPLLDRRKERQPGDRPFFTMVGIAALVIWLAFTFLILGNIEDINRDPPIITYIALGMLFAGIIWEKVRWGRFVPSIWHYIAYAVTITFMFVFNTTVAFKEGMPGGTLYSIGPVGVIIGQRIDQFGLMVFGAILSWPFIFWFIQLASIAGTTTIVFLIEEWMERRRKSRVAAPAAVTPAAKVVG